MENASIVCDWLLYVTDFTPTDYFLFAKNYTLNLGGNCENLYVKNQIPVEATGLVVEPIAHTSISK